MIAYVYDWNNGTRRIKKRKIQYKKGDFTIIIYHNVREAMSATVNKGKTKLQHIKVKVNAKMSSDDNALYCRSNFSQTKL